MSNKPIGATKVFSNPMMMYARRHSTSGSQSLISCKKHRQSLIQSLISVSARGDHVGAKSNPKTHACFGKSFVAAQWEVHGVVSNKPIGATKVFSNPMMMYARRHSTSGSQSLISCKKHRQSLIQSLISVSARGDHVGAKSNPKTHACFGKSFVAAQWEVHGVVSNKPSGRFMV